MFIIHPGADLCQCPGPFHKPKAAGNPAAFLHRETLSRREFLNPCRLRHTAAIHCSLFTIHLQRSPPGPQRNFGMLSQPGCVHQGKASAQPAARTAPRQGTRETLARYRNPAACARVRHPHSLRCASCSPPGAQRNPACYRNPAACTRVKHPHSLRARTARRRR